MCLNFEVQLLLLLIIFVMVAVWVILRFDLSINIRYTYIYIYVCVLIYEQRTLRHHIKITALNRIMEICMTSTLPFLNWYVSSLNESLELSEDKGPPLLTLFKSNPIMGKQSHSQLSAGWNYLSIPNFNGWTVAVWEWISKFIRHYKIYVHVITYPCWY